MRFVPSRRIEESRRTDRILRSHRPRNLFGGDAVSRHVVLRPGPDLAAEFPGLGALVFDVTGLRVKPADDAGTAFIEERVTDYRRTYAPETLKDEPRLRAYRDFFWRVGVDPTKVRPAAEALLRRVIQRKAFSADQRARRRVQPRIRRDANRIGGVRHRELARGPEDATFQAGRDLPGNWVG